MRLALPRNVSVRLVLLCVVAACAARASHAFGLQLYVTSDANDQVRRYAGNTGVLQNVFLGSVPPAAQQLGIHFGATNNRVLIGHFTGGVQEFNATTGAYIKSYNPTGGVQWAGIYGPNGNVIVGDWLTNDVREYNSVTGAYVQTLTTVASPADMVIGPNGNLFVCSYSNGYVKEVNATSGAFVSQWSQPAGVQTNDIAFNPANQEILVTGMITNVVYRYDNTHALLGTFAGTGWLRTHGIRISPWTGNVLVVDGVTAQVHEFNPTTYVELNAAFCSPPPVEKIVDLDFFRAPPVISTPICLGDGTLGTCPCGNIGALGHGCANVSFPGGTILTDSGTASVGADTLVLTAVDIPGPGLFIQSNGLAPTPIHLGDGYLCASVGIIRLGVAFPSGGIASYPAGQLPIHVAGSVSAGNVKHYQCWYRSQPALCTPGSNFGLSQGLMITWGS